ncbi:uncharacterized protein VDAG_07925 [Verticillium dahliae VdLs.17]|uniref:Zn(2)-C6 fungal-type domain-containing protein n=1 Tax=Verticillium dahliae (strain VdLs.17 / ATCC MYA-4575 / FGSC 10137) TaxID=498257 RepID=G2XCP3_VERDV|nr:uncharacterized protein VDAG_07925 [Verticillium dahliae VdLs.17]EGY16761.1 hypothetical protein VDAG_07925 [Verticillium dahliae VdLs.17]KAH6706870.1 hypothetical protein EV126DRAFT_410279 [Verticillium dahliae]
MSDPKTASSPGFLVHVMGRQARHAACDRCRAHKLRCQYDNDNARGGKAEDQPGSPSPRCRRCKRANMECIQSTSIRVVRPPKSSIRELSTPKEKPKSPTSAMKSQSSQQAHEFIEQNSSTNTALTLEGFSEAFGHAAGYTFDLPRDVQGHHADKETSDPNEVDFMFNDSLLSSGLQEFSEDLLFIDMAEGCTAPEHAAHAPVETRGGPGYPFDALMANPPAATLDFSCRQNDQSNSSVNSRSGQLEETQHKVLQGTLATSLGHSAGEGPGAGGGPEVQRGSDSDGNTDSLIQRLSVLSVSLHELSAETGKPAQPATTIRQNATPLLERIGFRCDDYPIDSILMATQTFVEILSGFIQMESCQCAELALKVQTRSDEGLSQLAPDVDSFPTFTGDEDHVRTQNRHIQDPSTNMDTDMCFDEYHGSDTECSSREQSKLDIHTALIIISCYTRIMRIYSDLVTYIRRQVHASAGPGASMSDRIANLPVLQLGTIQIRNDTALQALLLVRMGLHMIERIERILETLVGKSTCPCNKPIEADETDQGLRHQHSSQHRRSASSSILSQTSRTIALGGNGFATPLSRSSTCGSGHGGSSRRSVLSGSGSTCSHTEKRPNPTTSSAIRHIIELAIKQEDSESEGNGNRGIGSLKEDIRLLEQLLQ